MGAHLNFLLGANNPLKQFLPGFKFLLGLLLNILASFCRFSSSFFKLLGTWWHWITFCAPMGGKLFIVKYLTFIQFIAGNTFIGEFNV